MMNKREWMLNTLSLILAHSDERLSAEDCMALPSRLAQWYDAICATPEPADEGWIEHRGEKPYPEGFVEIRCRDGNREVGDADEFFWDRDPEDPSLDIIAWRPARA